MYEEGQKSSEIAKNWEFKYIVTEAYLKCLDSRFKLEQYMMGLPKDNPRAIFVEFISYLSAYYSTTMTDFNEYLTSKDYTDEPPFKYENRPFKTFDYLNLFNEQFAEDEVKRKVNIAKVLMMFNLLKYFCDTSGVFNLKNERHGPHEAFKYD